jgi:glycosyltransferase involved in cell wall biosynthesis
MQMLKYSLIVPIYNEEETIAELYRRVSAIMNNLDGEVELILVNDGSKDSSLKLLRELHKADSRVCYISFARNFGHQAAVTAGLNFCRGQVIIVLDADLQDPPELIPQMIEKWQEGYQVVYAQRTKRKQESWFKKLTAYLFYRLLKRLADVDIPADTGDFYIRGLRAWIGFPQTAVKFERDARFAGEVKYTFSKSLSLAINSLVSFSSVPLRFATYLGLFSALISLIMALLVLYWRLQQPDSPITGFATIMIAIFFLGSVQLISIGILGEYIGRIYEEVKGRPTYTIAELAGLQIS